MAGALTSIHLGQGSLSKEKFGAMYQPHTSGAHWGQNDRSVTHPTKYLHATALRASRGRHSAVCFGATAHQSPCDRFPLEFTHGTGNGPTLGDEIRLTFRVILLGCFRFMLGAGGNNRIGAPVSLVSDKSCSSISLHSNHCLPLDHWLVTGTRQLRTNHGFLHLHGLPPFLSYISLSFLSVFCPFLLTFSSAQRRRVLSVAHLLAAIQSSIFSATSTETLNSGLVSDLVNTQWGST